MPESKKAQLEKEQFEQEQLKKVAFIDAHYTEMVPIVEDKEVKAALEATHSDTNEARHELTSDQIETILKECETKIFVREKPQSHPDQKSVLIAANDPGAYNAMKPLVRRLMQDKRCKSIVVIASGKAEHSFEHDFGSDDFTEVKGESLLADILSTADKIKPDIIFSTMNSKNSPDSIMLFGGKSNLGAEQLFLIHETFGQQLRQGLQQNEKQMDTIDGIFCTDQDAKESIIHHVPEKFPHEHIYPIGSLALDTQQIEAQEKSRQETRKELKIDRDTHVMLYLGDISAECKEVYGTSDRLNEDTFTETLNCN